MLKLFVVSVLPSAFFLTIEADFCSWFPSALFIVIVEEAASFVPKLYFLSSSSTTSFTTTAFCFAVDVFSP